MKLKLERQDYTNESTIGKLYVDDVFECYTLEDVVRAKGAQKVFGQTAISSGTYDVDISYSPRFKTQLPIILGVPEFQGIRIHPGNTAKDTEGCILVGCGKGTNVITESRKAFEALFDKIKDSKDLTIEIV